MSDPQRTPPSAGSPDALAIYGGPAEIPEGPPSWPRPDPDVERMLLAAYATGDWGRYYGRFTEELAARLAALLLVDHVQLCASGTVAVELALRGLGIGAQDEVILSAYDFPGNFRAIEAVGACPVLVDTLPDNWSISVESIAEAAGPRTRAVVVSHLHGSLSQMPQIAQISRQLNLQVVEDACQVPGAELDGRPAGCWGDVGVWSFGGSKLLTAGRGGAVFTSDPLIAQRIRVAAERGNQIYPLSELQAAVLLPQLDKLALFTAARQEAARRLIEQTAGGRLLQPGPLPQGGQRPAYYKVGFLVRAPYTSARSRVIAALQHEGLAMDEGFRGFTNRSARRCRIAGSLVNARRLAEATVLLHHPVLLEPEPTQLRVVRAIQKVNERLDPSAPA